ncbi:Docking protein 3 [Merluccius polli]|uniref:Docking protein 3 n=1 Tax=Merluccius polli TaxID=89951 RepID=A0AA47NVH1_MERPO|nr:Docking protein 3 [Merluccius polli]
MSLRDPTGAGVGGERPSTVLGGDTKRHHHGHKDRKLKVVRLSDIISVRKLPPHAEALPKDNMTAFCVKTEERNLVFAAMKDEGTEWVEKVCEIAFQNQTGGFSVVVQQTDAAARCGLQGAYRLQVGQEDLSLRESENPRTIWSWPYRLLRRYGKDHLTLTIEAGRRCDSGPGTFTFETGQASVLFGLIENAIKHQTPSPTVTNSLAIHTVFQNPDGAATLPSRLPCSPLPKIPDMTSIPTTLENSLKIKSNTLSNSEESLYTQPLDKTISNPHLEVTSVYVDPASLLPLKPPATSSMTETPGPIYPSFAPSTVHGNHSEPIYSEVYDNISPGQGRAHLTQSQKGEMGNEPIYAEPVRAAMGAAKENDDKPDQFAHLYAEVCKLTPSSEKTIPFPSSGAAGTATVNTSDEALSDVIYETLGII